MSEEQIRSTPSRTVAEWIARLRDDNHLTFDERDQLSDFLESLGARSESASLKPTVEKAIRDIHGSWHACALGTKRHPLHDADRARGLKEGDLCDDCNRSIAAYMKDIFK